MKHELNGNFAGTSPPPLFVMGCKRSGTTLTARILDSHSQIAIIPDTHYYSFFRPLKYLYGDLRKPSNLHRLVADLVETVRVQNIIPTPKVSDILELLETPSFESVFAALLNIHSRTEGKIRSGEKTPDNFFYLNEILEKFPDSPVVFLMRDPRDVVLSMQKGFGDSTDSAIRMWNAAFQAYQQASRPVHLLQYERLVQQPTETVETMCQFLGVPYEEDMHLFYERISERMQASGNLGKLLGSVNSGSIGNFKQMPAREVERIEAACAEGMQAMGYAFVNDKPAALAEQEITVADSSNWLKFLLERLRYYGFSRVRWRYGVTVWTIILRLRVRYLLALEPWRKNG